MGISRPASCTYGIRKTIARLCRQTSPGSMQSREPTACEPSPDCRCWLAARTEAVVGTLRKQGVTQDLRDPLLMQADPAHSRLVHGCKALAPTLQKDLACHLDNDGLPFDGIDEGINR